ncbi:hypothetical protein BDR22DRAFT_711129 [Usnea florida]
MTDRVLCGILEACWEHTLSQCIAGSRQRISEKARAVPSQYTRSIEDALTLIRYALVIRYVPMTEAGWDSYRLNFVKRDNRAAKYRRFEKSDWQYLDLWLRPPTRSKSLLIDHTSSFIFLVLTLSKESVAGANLRLVGMHD